MVLEVYRITLLSNDSFGFLIVKASFRGLQNYTTLKLKRYTTIDGEGFRGLQNYTTLKPQIKFEAQE